MSMIFELVEKLRRRAFEYGIMGDDSGKLMSEAADTIEALSAKLEKTNMERPERYYSGGWILCKERLPEKDGFYLATIDGEIVGEDKPFSGLAEFENGKWIDDEDDFQCILAWMPLTEPYHEP